MRQSDVSDKVFGDKFTSGSLYTVPFSVVEGKTVRVFFSQKGATTYRDGLRIVDSNGKTVCRRWFGIEPPVGLNYC